MPTFERRYSHDDDQRAQALERFSPPVEPSMTITLTKSDYDDLAEHMVKGH